MTNQPARELTAGTDPLKRTIDDLAVFGGTPAFSHQIHVGRPNIGDRRSLHSAIDDLLDRRWLTNDGPCVRELESEIAKRIGVGHCIAVCNATIGLQLAIRALDLTGEVILPSFTFVATAHALEWEGCQPVFCDVDPHTHVLDPDDLRRRITERTTGILGVHVWGRPCAIDDISDIAREHNLRVAYDAAHAFGCSYRRTMIGNFGDVEVFSFHATKFLNTGEGGAVVTNDDRLAQRVRRLRNFGFVGYDQTESAGTNAKMPELSAALGLVNLASMDDFVATNREHYHEYRDHLRGVRGLSLAPYAEDEQQNFQYVVALVDSATAGVTRDQLVKILHHENVLARRYFYPGCHQLEPYRSQGARQERPWQLPNTELLTQRVFCLPTGTGVTRTDVATISDLLRFIIDNAADIAARERRLEEVTWVAPRTP